MFFNNKIYDEYFEKERVEYANFFLQIEHSLSLEYPDEIQGKIEDKNIHMFEQLFKSKQLINTNFKLIKDISINHYHILAFFPIKMICVIS